MQKRYIAVHGFFSHENKLLVLQRKNTGYMDGQYSLPAGHVDDHEMITKAMKRELIEELGIELDVQLAQLKHVMWRVRSDRQYVDCFFVFTKWDGEIHNREPIKCATLKWVSQTNLPDKVIPYIKFAWISICKHRSFSQIYENTDGQINVVG